MALKENMTRITVNIDKDKYEKVKEMAMKEGRAVSNYINFLIDKEIKKNQEKKFPLALLLLATIIFIFYIIVSL